jgi:hypothetical protein
MKKVLTILGVVVVAWLLLLAIVWIIQHTISDPAKADAATPVCQRACPLLRTDKYDALRPTATREWYFTLADPVETEAPEIILLSAGAQVTDPEKAGCGVAYVSGKIETAITNFDLLKAAMWQRFCWSHGHIHDVYDLHKSTDVTDLGQLTGWHEDGWRDGPSGWTSWGGKYHGGHYTTKTAKFKGCLNFPTGCVDDKSATIRLSLLEHAGGKFYTSVGK